ncbi:MAG: hypothetical protein ABT940_12035, partial [Alphaproteobacteria bacterium]
GKNWLEAVDMHGGPGQTTGHEGWTLQVDGQAVVDNHDHGSVDVKGHSGTIHTEHGDITFQNVDKIEW